MNIRLVRILEIGGVELAALRTKVAEASSQAPQPPSSPPPANTKKKGSKKKTTKVQSTPIPTVEPNIIKSVEELKTKVKTLSGPSSFFQLSCLFPKL